VLGKSKYVQIIAWSVAFCLTLGNFYLVFVEIKQKQTPDIVVPNISMREALDYIKSDEISESDMIEIVGSFYICKMHSGEYFMRYPEWIFLFRERNSDVLTEYRVFDGTMKSIDLPNVDKHFKDRNEGDIFYFTEIDLLTEKQIRISRSDIDGRLLESLYGKNEGKIFPEIRPGSNSFCIARSRVCGRITDYYKESIVHSSVGELKSVIVVKSKLPLSAFYKRVKPIKNLRYDIDECINTAIKNGAYFPMLTQGMTGGSRILRLLNTTSYNFSGPIWFVPLQINASPILISGINGKVYAMNHEGKYVLNPKKYLGEMIGKE